MSQLVAALDQRTLQHRDGVWSLRVIGVHDDGADFWIQISRTSNALDDLVLRVTSDATSENVIDVLSALQGGGSERIVNVVPGRSEQAATVHKSAVFPFRRPTQH